MSQQNSFLNNKINKGIQLMEKNSFKEAIKIFEEIKDDKHNKSTGLLFLGIIQIKKKNKSLAKKYFLEILETNKNHEDGNLNLALVYFDEKNFVKCLLYLDKVININNNNLTAHYHKGLVNFFSKKLNNAIKSFEICINLNENFLYSYLNLGHIYLRTKKFDKALENYKKVLTLEPKHNPSKFNLSWCYFALSDYDNAFKYYEFRKEKTNPRNKLKEVKDKFASKEWSGEDLNTKTILIIAEQGIGDNIQFFRYLFWLKEKYKTKILFYVDKKLLHLFKNSNFEIVSNLENINKIDYYQHLLSLPGKFYEEKNSFQKIIPYIKINSNNYLKWKNILNNFKKPIVALNWQGDPNFLFDDIRSIKLSLFKDIIKIKKYSFISLQKGYGSEQIKLNSFTDLIFDFSNKIDLKDNAFEDTISILKNIDLLITSDTAIAHLAGTLNVKTYLILNYNPEWRWFIELKSNCFYPSVKIIQQPEPDNWNFVFKKIEDLLNKY